jgi:hypothetical protein
MSAADVRRSLLHRLMGPKLPLPLPRLLCVCAACGADFVNPVRWITQEDGQRRVHLRCGACGLERDVVVTPTSAALLEAAHEARVAQIAQTLERLERDRMAAWADTFTQALERDLIDAADFTRVDA